MKIIVLKFGGTSVGTIKRINNISKIIVSYLKKRFKVIVVTSAMSGATNKLIKKSKQISDKFNDSEYDVLVSSGEQISCSLIAAKLSHLGYKSKSYLGWQVPIVTDNAHKSAKIISIGKKVLINYLRQDGVPIVAGFQGISLDGRITTLGRGASDYTAIMISKYFKAKKCIIYTDVEGVMTTDPRIYRKAKKIKEISYEEMLEMSSLGSKVMQSNSVQDARLSRVNIDVRSSLIKSKGTLIKKKKNVRQNNVIRGISSTTNDAKVTLVGVKDKPGVAASIFEPLSTNNINVDMVVQNISPNKVDTDVTFTVKKDDLNKTKKLTKNNKRIKFRKVLIDDKVSKVSIIGVGMITTPGVTYRMFKALSKKNINILVISTSEIKISVLVSRTKLRKAVSALHQEFKLD